MSAAIFMILFSISPVLALMQLLYIPAAKYPVKKISKSVEKEIKTVVSKNAENNQIKGDIFKAIDFINFIRCGNPLLLRGGRSTVFLLSLGFYILLYCSRGHFSDTACKVSV